MSSLTHSHWGAWELDWSNCTLKLEYNGHVFQFELADLGTTGQMLDCILEVSGKTWASSKDVGDLVSALDALLDPRQNLCPGGANRAIDTSDLLRSRFKKENASRRSSWRLGNDLPD